MKLNTEPLIRPAKNGDYEIKSPKLNTEEEMTESDIKLAVGLELWNLLEECEWDFHRGSRVKKLKDFIESAQQQDQLEEKINRRRVCQN